MKSKNPLILIISFLILCLVAAIGYHFLEKRNYEKTISQLQSVSINQATQIYEYRPVYGLNDKSELQKLFFTRINPVLPLQEQLSLLAASISRFCFSSLPIEIQGIQELGNKKVATVNLRESEDFRVDNPEKTKSWVYGYFQGSFGGAQTTTTLVESFLQREYPLNWIDGVIFLYEHQPMDHFDHVPGLGKVSYK